eukprot:TRINITY_DN5440_c0_g1_i8.p1 TRINITY_DN5440_c0_g1~~TRINITY_DN5440_c0_g1_i8.p1  ORF type:complete len:329 (+),score=71.52 TRINITY_DN5440_c0_g1_i8:227-1213(+)
MARTGLVLALLLLPYVTGSAFNFSVCSQAGGSHGVDFRSHFAVYCTYNKVVGWVRNACDNCVYGQFSGGDAATELKQILESPSRVVAELDSKASNLTITVSPIAEYPLENCQVPAEYRTGFGVVDWSYAIECSTACSCRPTGYTDCQQTSPLPSGVSYTKDCQRYPLGNSSKNFADCNSIHTDQSSNSCWKLVSGTISSSGLCNASYADLSFAASNCCTAKSTSYQYNRQGVAIPPSPAVCSAYSDDQAYENKCTAATSSSGGGGDDTGLAIGLSLGAAVLLGLVIFGVYKAGWAEGLMSSRSSEENNDDSLENYLLYEDPEKESQAA